MLTYSSNVVKEKGITAMPSEVHKDNVACFACLTARILEEQDHQALVTILYMYTILSRCHPIGISGLPYITGTYSFPLSMIFKIDVKLLLSVSARIMQLYHLQILTCSFSNCRTKRRSSGCFMRSGTL